MARYGTFSRTILEDSPVAYYRCADDPATLTLTDSSGNSRNGVVAVGCTSSFGSMRTSYDDDAGLYCDGTSGELISSTNAALVFGSNTQYTIEFAFFMAGTMTALCRDDTGSAGHIALFETGGFVSNRMGGTTNASTKASLTYNDLKWHYCQVVRRGTTTQTAEVYIDGEKIIDATTGTGAVTTKWHFGKNGTLSAYIPVYVDEWSFYNTALSTTRLTAHLTAWETLPSPSPLMTGIG